MATVQIRNLNDDAYAILRRRAAASGRSLQEYLRVRLEAEAAGPTVDELLTDVRSELTSEVPLDTIVGLIREDRDRDRR
jgi:plasmid stability protein